MAPSNPVRKTDSPLLEPRVPEDAKAPVASAPKLLASKMNFFYGKFQALYDINIKIHTNQVTAFIGPSGCGKSTFLRTINRMNLTVRNSRAEGEILLDNQDILTIELSELRRRVGMVFQKSNPFPKTIFDNVAYGLRINGMTRSREDLRDRVEASLKSAALWDEGRDRLRAPALAVSG